MEISKRETPMYTLEDLTEKELSIIAHSLNIYLKNLQKTNVWTPEKLKNTVTAQLLEKIRGFEW